MVDVACPSCGEAEAAELFRAADRLGLKAGLFRLVRCASCGLVYQSPRPDDDELGSCYPRTYWGDRQRGVGGFLRGVEERFKEGYKLRALRRAGVTGGRVLDIGCGRGEFLLLLRKRGFEVAGLEPGDEAAERGRAESGLDITHGRLSDNVLPEGRFDAVTLWHVLEHLPDPLGALTTVRSLLRPGGAVFIAVPDFGGVQAGLFGSGWFGVDAPRHLTHFTRRSLAGMLARAGFGRPDYYPGGARYEAAMLVRSLWPGLNAGKLRALERGSASRYLYKAVQLALDLGLMPAGLALSLTGRGSTFTAVSRVI